MSTTDRRRLSRLPVESLVVAGVNTKLVLLVNARDDHILMSNKAHRIEEDQAHARTLISGREYITLQCHILECRHHDAVVSGGSSGMYKETQFVGDFKIGRAGFTVQFSGGGTTPLRGRRLLPIRRRSCFSGRLHCRDVSTLCSKM